MPTVAVAHTAQKHRSLEAVYSLVCEAMEQLGGFDRFVKPGQSVLIKPDQSCPRLAEQGSTTDPLLVAAIIRLAQKAGASKIQVGASSSGFFNSLECMQVTGIAAIAAQEGAELVDLGSNDVPNIEIELPEGRVLNKAMLPQPLLDTEVIIAVPKAKTDFLDGISGSLEFCSGSVNQDWRARQSREGDVVERYADIMTGMRPDLWIVDAIICGEGNGPHGNVPRWCGCVLACADPVATDTAVAMLMNHNYEKLRFKAALDERGLGYRMPLVYLGKPLETLVVNAWPAHKTFDYMPINVLVGKGVTEAGTIAHVRNAIDTLSLEGVLQQSLHNVRGTPTLMLGDVEDPDFETHLEQGPYTVFDDAAQDKYKNDPRVLVIGGHPVTETTPEQWRRVLGVPEKKSIPVFDQGKPLPRFDELNLPGARHVDRTRSPLPATAALACLSLGALLLMRASHRRT